MKMTLTPEERLVIMRVLYRMPLVDWLLSFLGMLGICHLINDFAFYAFGWSEWPPRDIYFFSLLYSVVLVAMHRWMFKRRLAEEARPERKAEEEIVRQADEVLRRAREDEGRTL
jgi:hypothetical protein